MTNLTFLTLGLILLGYDLCFAVLWVAALRAPLVDREEDL